MTGPTREEVDELALALLNAERHYNGGEPAEDFNGLDICTAALFRDDAGFLLNKPLPLLRARHVREAVEGLSGVDAPDADFILLEWDGEDGRHYEARFPRAVLLAALTGEGK